MTLHALTSPGGSPGVTTTALALALTWPAPVILAECDPSGGDILAGLFTGHLPARSGLLTLAMEAGRGREAITAALPGHLTELADIGRKLLPGITDPRQAAAVGPAWPALAAALAAQPGDVIADCGRLDAAGAPLAVLTAAATVTMILRPTLRQVSKARPRVEMLAQVLGGTQRIVLLLAGDGEHSAREVREALGAEVAGVLPHDEKTARMLSDGRGSRRGLDSRPLLRAARVTAGTLAARVPAAPLRREASSQR